MGFLGKIAKGIGKAFKAVGNFAKKAVSFASKVLNGPLATIASFIPGVGPFIAGAAKIVGVADSVLNGKGLSGIVSGLVGSLGGGLLGKAGSLLSGTGLGTALGFLNKAGDSNQLFDMVKSFMGPRQGNTSTAAQGDVFNLQQFSAFKMAQLLRPTIQF